MKFLLEIMIPHESEVDLDLRKLVQQSKTDILEQNSQENDDLRSIKYAICFVKPSQKSTVEKKGGDNNNIDAHHRL